MKWLQQHRRGLTHFLAFLFMGVGGFCGYWWLYKLAPARRTLDPEWRAAHSQQAYWREVQKGIHRGMWFHDDGFTVGLYGDKSWAEWIMAHVQPGTSMAWIGGPIHSAISMRHITNQDVGNTADEWLAWWEENHTKSQEEWIADGFRKHGYDIYVPPIPEQIPMLLEILGRAYTHESRVIPEEMGYNAFRFLRDSGFEPVAYALTNRTLSEEVELGLMEYVKMERYFPSVNAVGILAFGAKDDDCIGVPGPPMLEPRFQIMANVLLFGFPLMGMALLVVSFRTSRRD